MWVQKFRIIKTAESKLGLIMPFGLTDVGPRFYAVTDCDTMEEAQKYIEDFINNSGKVIPGTENLEKPAHYPVEHYKDYCILPVYIKVDSNDE